ncbi:hypothetical protein L226DRAFT_573141 [Lentinus tigrinus ALCF2SS1-7]|uniref:uncharacterized protein n=1 Tax=Lentinus tigrinus ALCF2SS1-7 TaxID=1328758 RepID=UPI0011663D50|nr:hypothetical protein L226DRAFT_573141 [Lentinus tigrinus ALCF2SS1-7]
MDPLYTTQGHSYGLSSSPIDVSHVMGEQVMIQPCYAHVSDHSTLQWPLYYSYNNPEYAAFQSDVVDHHWIPSPVALPIRIPPRISTYSSLLPTPSANGVSESSWQYPPAVDAPGQSPSAKQPHTIRPNAPEPPPPLSELLADQPTHVHRTPPHIESPERASANEDAPSESALGKRKREVEQPEIRRLNQRKTYFRAVSENVGFTITDPDTIPSHEKKRNYLECLEEYVQWLHEQIHLVGQQPLPLKRVSTYGCFKTGSLRTILVHKQNVLQQLNLQKMQAEAKVGIASYSHWIDKNLTGSSQFMELQNAVLMRQAAKVRWNSRGTQL